MVFIAGIAAVCVITVIAMSWREIILWFRKGK
jgi:hypothetical protein